MIDLVCCIAAIGIHIGSYHVNNQTGQELNNINPGAYVELTNGVVLGSYYNSLRRNSEYVGFKVEGPYHTSVIVGAITGYSDKPILAIIPSVNWGPVRLSYIPKVSLTKVHTFHISIEKRF